MSERAEAAVSAAPSLTESPVDGGCSGTQTKRGSKEWGRHGSRGNRKRRESPRLQGDDDAAGVKMSPRQGAAGSRRDGGSTGGRPAKKSKYCGVSHDSSGRWEAYIYRARKKIYLGNWDKDHDAARAHDRAAINFFGRDAPLASSINFPLEDYDKDVVFLEALPQDQLVASLRSGAKQQRWSRKSREQGGGAPAARGRGEAAAQQPISPLALPAAALHVPGSSSAGTNLRAAESSLSAESRHHSLHAASLSASSKTSASPPPNCGTPPAGTRAAPTAGSSGPLSTPLHLQAGGSAAAAAALGGATEGQQQRSQGPAGGTAACAAQSWAAAMGDSKADGMAWAPPRDAAPCADVALAPLKDAERKQLLWPSAMLRALPGCLTGNGDAPPGWKALPAGAAPRQLLPGGGCSPLAHVPGGAGSTVGMPDSGLLAGTKPVINGLLQDSTAEQAAPGATAGGTTNAGDALQSGPFLGGGRQHAPLSITVPLRHTGADVAIAARAGADDRVLPAPPAMHLATGDTGSQAGDRGCHVSVPQSPSGADEGACYDGSAVSVLGSPQRRERRRRLFRPKHLQDIRRMAQGQRISQRELLGRRPYARGTDPLPFARPFAACSPGGAGSLLPSPPPLVASPHPLAQAPASCLSTLPGASPLLLSPGPYARHMAPYVGATGTTGRPLVLPTSASTFRRVSWGDVVAQLAARFGPLSGQLPSPASQTSPALAGPCSERPLQAGTLPTGGQSSGGGAAARWQPPAAPPMPFRHMLAPFRGAGGASLPDGGVGGHNGFLPVSGGDEGRGHGLPAVTGRVLLGRSALEEPKEEPLLTGGVLLGRSALEEPKEEPLLSPGDMLSALESADSYGALSAAQVDGPDFFDMHLMGGARAGLLGHASTGGGGGGGEGGRYPPAGDFSGTALLDGFVSLQKAFSPPTCDSPLSSTSVGSPPLPPLSPSAADLACTGLAPAGPRPGSPPLMEEDLVPCGSPSALMGGGEKVRGTVLSSSSDSMRGGEFPELAEGMIERHCQVAEDKASRFWSQCRLAWEEEAGDLLLPRAP